MKILVTGGCGFIGSHLVHALVHLKHDVVVLDDLSGGFERNLPESGVHFIKGSVVNTALVNFICREHKFDAIYHLAAYAAEGLSHFIRHFNYTNNVIGSVNLINAAVEYEVKKFVFTSSIAVYGHAAPPFHETTPTVPADPYGVAKLAVEQDLAAAAKMFGLNYTVFRPHNVYGPRQHIGDKYRNVVGIFMNQILSERPLTIFGDGHQTRAFSYVGDIVPPMIQCLHMPETAGLAFNIGGRRPYTVNQLADAVRDVAGVITDVVHLDARNEVVHAHSDHTRLRKFFGEGIDTDLHVGLRLMWNWARLLGPQAPTPAPTVEVDRNMPPSWRSV